MYVRFIADNTVLTHKLRLPYHSFLHAEVRKAFTQRNTKQENGQHRNERLSLPPILVAGTQGDFYCLAGSGLLLLM